MPNDFECAAFALDIYRDVQRPALPDGWRLYLDYAPGPDDKGYFGACYIKEVDYPSIGKIPEDIVFAHRGTVLSVDDIIADIAVALGNVPVQYANAKDFYDSTIAKLKDEFPSVASGIEFMTSQVGHSLGSIITEIMCAATFGDNPGFTKRSVSFESPGSKPNIQTMVEAKALPANALTVAEQNCCIIQTHYDVINTCNEQVSSVSTVAIPFNFKVDGGPDVSPPGHYFENTYYLVGYSIEDQHKMKHIYDYLSTGGLVSIAGTWPFGFANGYAAYKQLPLGAYWDSYIKICWDTHPEIQAAYQGNYDKYYEYFINTYLSKSLRICNERPTPSLSSGVGLFKETPEGFILVDRCDTELEEEVHRETKKTGGCSLM